MKAGSSLQPVAIIQECQPPQMIGAQRTEEEKDEEKSRTEGSHTQLRRRQKRCSVTLTPNAYYSYHTLDRPDELGTTLRAQRFSRLFRVDKYFMIQEKRLSCLRRNQNGCRAADYMSLREYLGVREMAINEEEDWMAGRLLVLLMTFVRADR